MNTTLNTSLRKKKNICLFDCLYTHYTEIIFGKKVQLEPVLHWYLTRNLTDNLTQVLRYADSWLLCRYLNLYGKPVLCQSFRPLGLKLLNLYGKNVQKMSVWWSLTSNKSKFDFTSHDNGQFHIPLLPLSDQLTYFSTRTDSEIIKIKFLLQFCKYHHFS
jgi:hypothetical protein